MNENLYALFAENFPKDGSLCCIETEEGRHYSWSDIERHSAQIANLLNSLGCQTQARIVVQVEKSPEALFLYLAALRAGFVFVPLNTAYKNAEVEYFLNDAQPEIVICASDNMSWIRPLSQKAGCQHIFSLDAFVNSNDHSKAQSNDSSSKHRNDCSNENPSNLLHCAQCQSDQFSTVYSHANDLAAILYTSGTTGRSKGAMLSHGNLGSNAKTLQKLWAWNQEDVLLHALPIFHVHGLFVATHGALLNGTKMIFLTKFYAKTICHLLSRASIFMGVPTYYVRLLQETDFTQEICQNMRLFISGSAPLLPDTFTQFKQRTGHTILERYGMSETVMLTSNPYHGERKAGTVGHALPMVTVRIADAHNAPCKINDIGDIQVKGPNVFQGYWRMPEVNESAVIGVSHGDFGEAVCAVVVLKNQYSMSESEIIQRLKRQIANFKVPKYLFFAQELPRNTMGKVQKNSLREQLQKKLAQ